MEYCRTHSVLSRLVLCVTVLTSAISTAQGGAASPTHLNPDLLKEFCWRMVGPAMPSGRVWAVVGVESDPKTIYARTASGGVWKTTNHGTTWKPIFEHEGSSSIGAIAVAKQNPNIAWVGTGEPASVRSNRLGDGVYKSTDGGETWTNMGLLRMIRNSDSRTPLNAAKKEYFWQAVRHNNLSFSISTSLPRYS